MNIIDYKFDELVEYVKKISKNELYYHIRKKFDSIPDETKKNCAKFFNQFGYWGNLDLENHNYEEIEMKVDELHNHIDDFKWLYYRLADYRSKKTLYAILNNWLNYDFVTTNMTQERMYDDYFDLDLISECEDEVLVDLGAYNGDTIISYINNYGKDSYKKIYCYEITPKVFEELKLNLKDFKNIEFKLKGVGDKVERLKLSINESISANTLEISDETDTDVTTLDEDIKEEITIIKADIEGFEQKALIGSFNHILNDHPKLLISVYHSNEDLWKIPRLINDISSDYKFYLRFHGSIIYPTEITLIAI